MSNNIDNANSDTAGPQRLCSFTYRIAEIGECQSPSARSSSCLSNLRATTTVSPASRPDPKQQHEHQYHCAPDDI